MSPRLEGRRYSLRNKSKQFSRVWLIARLSIGTETELVRVKNGSNIPNGIDTVNMTCAKFTNF